MAHRGPDGEGFYVTGDMAFAHRRLSIIDIAGGAQPMIMPDGSAAVTFNGEIYNFRELRDDLKKLGHAFNTNSDTEVLLHAYSEYGVDFINRIDGMFAFAIWDNKEKMLVLASDPFGKKPMYYCSHNGIFYFSSELKSLRMVPGLQARIDPLSLQQYLCYEYIPTPRSIFTGISKIEAGTIIIVKDGYLVKRRYWDFNIVEDSVMRKTHEKDIVVELDGLLREAVRKRLISDVPLGVFLSGGIDSSLITMYMAEIFENHNEIKTFSIGFMDRSFDESHYARTIARCFSTDHYEKILSPEKLLEMLPGIIDKLDEPMADASLVPTSLLAQFASNHVKVALGGDGGDELFFGYPTFQATLINNGYRYFPGFVNQMINRLVNYLPVSHDNITLEYKMKQFFKGAHEDIRYYQQIWIGALNYNESCELLGTKIYNVEDIYAPSIAIYRKVINHLDNVSEMFVKTYLKDNILAKVDRASMAYSLEARAPFLDKKLADFVMRIPARYKMKRLTTKYILKRLLESRLPKEIISRPKKGFGIPIAKWFSGPLKNELKETLSKENVIKASAFDPVIVQRLIADHLNRVKDNRKILWSLYVFHKWANHVEL